MAIYWLEGMEPEHDLCAHGRVGVRIGDEWVVDHKDEWTLSAMALHLLRTLEQDHQPDRRVGDHLVPCCGHHIVHLPDNPAVHVQGCFTGLNWWVVHRGDRVELRSELGTTCLVPFEDYKEQVLRFVDEVEAFYQQEKEKVLPTHEYDRTGYLLFWEEWRKRRRQWFRPLGD